MSGLVGQILSIPSGGKAIVTLSAAGKSGVFVVYYDEQRAIGDSGHSVPGMVSGEYEVWMAKNSDNPTPDHNILRQHVSPGKPGGQQMAWAAEQCARAITNAVLRYGSVERKAMNRMAVAKELVRVAKELVAVPMSFDAPTMETTRWAERTLRVALNADASWRKIYELFMTVEDGTSNKFHYFAVFRSRTGECVGGNAYGRIGYNPKAIEVARGSEGSVMSDVRAKASLKQRSKGYQIREV